MEKQEVSNLLAKYLAGKCTEEERAILETWYLTYEEKELPELHQDLKDEQLKEIWEALAKEIETPVYPIGRKLPWTSIASAAILLLSLSIGFYFYRPKQEKTISIVKEKSITQKPITNKAMLTLADGRTISLDEAQNGEIARQAGVTITKTKDGQLVYTGKADASAINRIITPKGSQYQLSLPDGTKVWLNAASSLSYPAAFTGAKREVNLIGEAYFEVSENRKMPFIVHSKGQEIEVLGTHFNVNAYDDETRTETTLIKGSVRVKLLNSTKSTLLKPGEQAVVELNKLDKSAVNVAEAIAWKEGYFLFEDEGIQSIMRKIARWYDIDVVYAPNISQQKLGGNISRSKPLTTVLKTFSNTDKFNFKVEGRRVTVMP